MIYKNYSPNCIIYSLSMLRKKLDLILAWTFTCRMPGKCSVPGRQENKAAGLTDGAADTEIFILSLWERKYAEMIFSKLADNLFIFAVGRKPVIVIKMLQIFSQYPYCCKVFLAVIQPCISRLISYNTCCGLKLIKSTPWNESFLTI